MKKFLHVVMGVVVMIVLAGCGGGSESSESKATTDTYVAELAGAKLEATFTHADDKLLKVEQTMVYPYTYLGFEDASELDEDVKQQLVEQVEAQYDGYSDSEGTSLASEFTDDGLVLTMSIDLEKADSEAVSSLLGGTSDPKNISYKDTIEEFEANGFEKK